MGWLCFNTDSDSDSSDEVNYNLRYIYERLYPNAARDQPQQPEPHSLCQSICDFFNKCLCCGCCIRGFDNEHQQPGANPVAVSLCLPITIWNLLWLQFFGHRTDESED